MKTLLYISSCKKLQYDEICLFTTGKLQKQYEESKKERKREKRKKTMMHKWDQKVI